MSKVKTSAELGAALAKGESTIEIEGDLARKVIRIKATGKVAWLIAFAAIGLAYIAIRLRFPAVAATAPAAASAALVSGSSAVAILGPGAVIAAVQLALTAGGMGVLARLRSDYEVSEKNDDGVVLTKS